jgi:hypothetical protein
MRRAQVSVPKGVPRFTLRRRDSTSASVTAGALDHRNSRGGSGDWRAGPGRYPGATPVYHPRDWGVFGAADPQRDRGHSSVSRQPASVLVRRLGALGPCVGGHDTVGAAHETGLLVVALDSGGSLGACDQGCAAVSVALSSGGEKAWPQCGAGGGRSGPTEDPLCDADDAATVPANPEEGNAGQRLTGTCSTPLSVENGLRMIA